MKNKRSESLAYILGIPLHKTGRNRIKILKLQAVIKTFGCQVLHLTARQSIFNPVV